MTGKKKVSGSSSLVTEATEQELLYSQMTTSCLEAKPSNHRAVSSAPWGPLAPLQRFLYFKGYVIIPASDGSVAEQLQANLWDKPWNGEAADSTQSVFRLD